MSLRVCWKPLHASGHASPDSINMNAKANQSCGYRGRIPRHMFAGERPNMVRRKY